MWTYNKFHTCKEVKTKIVYSANMYIKLEGLHICLRTALYLGEELGKWRWQRGIPALFAVSELLLTEYTHVLLERKIKAYKFRNEIQIWIKKRDTYLLDNKENPPPRIPESTGDYFCKQDKRKQPLNFCLEEKNNNQ